jgi:uncharacterized protein
MVTKNQILSFLEENKSYFLKDFNLSKIGIFGSFAKDIQKENSDLDLIVEFKPGTENLYENKQKMKKFIEDKLNIKVDICREKYIKDIFKEKILSDATYI